MRLNPASSRRQRRPAQLLSWAGTVGFELSSGAVLAVTTFVTTGTLTLLAGTIDNLGTLLDQGSLILASPSTTLEGGGLVQLVS